MIGLNDLGINNDTDLISWINEFENASVVVSMYFKVKKIKDETGTLSQEIKNSAETTLRIIAGLQNLDSLTTTFINKFFVSFLGDELTSLNGILFDEHAEAWSNIDQDNNLNLGDWTIISAKSYVIYIDYKLNGNEFDQARAEKDSAFIALLSNVKSLIGEHWPQNAEQWEALGQILLQFLGEIGIAFIPGSDIIGVVEGLDEGDYVAVTFGIAGLLVDAFGGTILKVIGKVAKFGYKSFKIFKIVFRYLDEVVDFIALGHKVELFEGTVRILGDFNQAIASIQDNVLKLLKNSAKSIIKVADLKLLDNIVPTGAGHINANKINNKALRIDPQNSDYKSIVDDIKLNGDPQGNLSEDIMDDLLEQDGFKKPIQSVEYPNLDTVQLNGGQRFDNVLIKRDISGNITEIIINESKQVSNTGTIDLSSGVSGTLDSLCFNCTQMSTQWIDDVLVRMQIQGGDLGNLANDISSFIDSGNEVTQLVSGVSKNTGELVILNITGFSTP
nr:hypothetical protein [uncultured Psychroserpens sp.]